MQQFLTYYLLLIFFMNFGVLVYIFRKYFKDQWMLMMEEK